MAISRVGSASAQATTITIPTHQSGDLILIVANRNNITAATVPSGWVASSTGGSGVSTAFAWKLAKSSSETSGTFTNAVALHCAVYRASSGILAMSTSSSGTTASSTTIIYSANGSYRVGSLDNWWIATAFQLNSANSLETAPSGMTNINSESSAGNWKSVLHDTNASQLSNWASTNVTVTTSAVSITRVMQIIEFDGPAFGGGFRPVNIRGGADQ
jgi:hypothetical protein